MELFIVRHGECRAQRDPDDASPDSPLTPLGEIQARSVAERLTRDGITHIVSSPLVRALATASIVGAACRQPIAVWLDACEIWQDAYQGQARDVLSVLCPAAIFPVEMTDAGWSHAGDTEDSLHARCERVAARLVREFAQTDRVAFVSHGGFLNHLLHVLLHIPSDHRLWFHLENASLSVLRFISRQQYRGWPLYPPFTVEVRALNDTTHLVHSRSS